MRLMIRTDASGEIATGHVFRCLVLANQISRTGIEVSFICRSQPGSLETLIIDQGFEVHILPSPELKDGPFQGNESDPWLLTSWQRDAAETESVLRRIGSPDWMVVDHYGIDGRWHRHLRSQAPRIAVVDDLANRPHECDLLLDQNLGRKPDDYRQLVPTDSIVLLGPRFALLRPEFARWRDAALARRSTDTPVHKLLLNLGGVDVDNTGGMVLELLASAESFRNLEIILIMGATAVHYEDVAEFVERSHLSVRIYHGTHAVAELMTDSDIAIGAAGATSWERCCLGLPSLLFTTAENQRFIADNLHAEGAAIHVGTPAQVRAAPGRLLDPLARLLEDPAGRIEMARRAAGVVDGQGARRVADALLEAE